MNVFVFIIILLLLFYVSVTDILYRVIPNLVILIMFICIVTDRLIYSDIPINFILILCVFGTGILLYAARIMGAGDVKLITVLTFLIPEYPLFISFLFYTTLTGAGLAVLGYMIPALKFKERGLPYGVAIALGFLMIACPH
ncbi:prepilin peptidase [Salmonella enterica]|uniref:Flp operon protein B n=2 Tax=Salmonella enterica TaxID=28901 RepID=A0A607IH61_SALET|nr:prepilin peptidase [Salmonella enterica]EBS4769656.1 flp operon protein B [Salmonella enterica subsp. enterica serovar Sandiego]ECH8235008.1 flp operon protein B [Salmonella enterica subsp. enterica]EIB5177275.1 flp operon protein B [Salmonella enterica subsp. enterica serovar Maracaibo]EAB2306927.1 flp operon protein B [Salmonella enterica]EAB3911061.1 flp operon protein B [Salmonella enterica]